MGMPGYPPQYQQQFPPPRMYQPRRRRRWPWVVGAVVVLVVASAAGLVMYGGGSLEDAGTPPPPHRESPDWPGRYTDQVDICAAVDPGPFSAIAHLPRGDNSEQEEPKHVYDTTKLECTAMLYNNGANADEAEGARNLRIWATAYVQTVDRCRDTCEASPDAFPLSELFDNEVADAKEVEDSRLTFRDMPIDNRSGELTGIGDRAHYSFLAGKESGPSAYEASYELMVQHGNLIVELEFYVLRQPAMWTKEDIEPAARDVAITMMERMRAR